MATLLQGPSRVVDDARAGAWLRRASVGAFVVLAALGVARIVATYPVFSQTTDEPAHVAAGMEWLQRGSYTFEPLHPPLARVSVALGPYLSGRRLSGTAKMWKQGDDILMQPGRYEHVLALARLGVLPFFLLAAFLVWDWTRRRYGDASAILATALLTTTPAVLGHSGLATTDMPLTATCLAALAAFISFLRRPTSARAVVLGIAAGVATLAKFSAILFLPAAALALLAWRWFLQRQQRSDSPRPPFSWSRSVGIVAVSGAMTIWAGYRFSVGAMTQPTDRPHASIDRLVGSSGALHDASYRVAEAFVVPAPALFHGLAALSTQGRQRPRGVFAGSHSADRLVVLLPRRVGSEDAAGLPGPHRYRRRCPHRRIAARARLGARCAGGRRGRDSHGDSARATSTLVYGTYSRSIRCSRSWVRSVRIACTAAPGRG